MTKRNGRFWGGIGWHDTCQSKTAMKILPSSPILPTDSIARSGDDPAGIVILDGGMGARFGRRLPRVRAFVYGEEPSIMPTLPFGRWKEAS